MAAVQAPEKLYKLTISNLSIKDAPVIPDRFGKPRQLRLVCSVNVIERKASYQPHATKMDWPKDEKIVCDAVPSSAAIKFKLYTKHRTFKADRKVLSTEERAAISLAQELRSNSSMTLVLSSSDPDYRFQVIFNVDLVDLQEQQVLSSQPYLHPHKYTKWEGVAQMLKTISRIAQGPGEVDPDGKIAVACFSAVVHIFTQPFETDAAISSLLDKMYTSLELVIEDTKGRSVNIDSDFPTVAQRRAVTGIIKQFNECALFVSHYIRLCYIAQVIRHLGDDVKGALTQYERALNTCMDRYKHSQGVM